MKSPNRIVVRQCISINAEVCFEGLYRLEDSIMFCVATFETDVLPVRAVPG